MTIYDVFSVPDTMRVIHIVGLVNLSCDFESDFCSWYQDMADNFNWRRAANGTHDATSGPQSDHITGRKYLHVYMLYPSIY